MKTLQVLYEGWGETFQLGLLADDGHQLLFEYSGAALRRGLEFSPHAMRLQAGARGNFPEFQSRLPGFISDSLPDGWGLLLMDRLMRRRDIDVRRLSPLDRLAFLGRRTMGALTYQPDTEVDLARDTVSLLALAEESQNLMEDKSTDLLRTYVKLGGSAHGARPKVLVNIDPDTDRAWTTEDSPGLPWIVKFPGDGEHPEVCAVEQLYADLARMCGLAIPPTRYFELGKTERGRMSAFGAQRFDRDQGRRVPIHTAAGAAHVDFRLPSSIDYLTFLRLTQKITRDVREVEVAFERCVFNVIFNNRDDHPKNFSFRMEENGQWRVSPAYDLTFNRGAGGEHHMDVCGELRDISAQAVLKLARQADIREPRARQIIDRMAEVAGRVRAVATAYPLRNTTAREIVSAIEANRDRVAGSG